MNRYLPAGRFEVVRPPRSARRESMHPPRRAPRIKPDRYVPNPPEEDS